MADASGMRVHSNHLNVHKLEFLLGVHAMRRFYLYHVLPVSRLPKAIIIFHNLHLNSQARKTARNYALPNRSKFNFAIMGRICVDDNLR